MFISRFPRSAQLALLTTERLRDGFRPATLRQYNRMWRDFLSFQVAAELPTFPVTPSILLAYLEYLSKCRLSDSHMANHMAALRAFHIMHGLCTKAFQDQRISLYFKSLKLNRQFAPDINPTLTVATL